MTAQWIRSCSLVIADDETAVELAGALSTNVLKIKFTVHYQTRQTPASLHARVYNLSGQTVEKILSLTKKNPPSISAVPFATSGKVTLKAGYVENIGVIFEGFIYQLRVGKESSVNSYLDIFASDGDLAHNWATMSTTFAAGYTGEDIWKAAGRSMSPWKVATADPPDGLSTNGSPRGRVVFGMTKDVLRDHAESNNYTWNILGQQLQGYPKFTVRKGEVIVINRYTGMIGVPEQTEQGISAVVLLNPAIRWGTQVKINDTDIARLLLKSPNANYNIPTTAATSDQKNIVPPINSDGIYVVIYARHEGDTRDNSWYTHITCLSIDPTAVIPKAVTNVALPPPLSEGKAQ